jgi:Ca-activated chloride channel family protein
MKKRILFFLQLLLGACLVMADGFIIIHDPPPYPRPWPPPHPHPMPHPMPMPMPRPYIFAPLEISYHKVNVEINGLTATTDVDQEFRNPNPQRLEGTYIFPIPEGAHVDKFEMDIDGKMVQAELLDAEKARQIYEDIVRKMKDPALMEYAGRGAFKARIYPIEPNSTKKIKLRYSQVLKPDSGFCEYSYPLNTEKFSSVPVREVAVTIKLQGGKPLTSLYSPSHPVTVTRDGDTKATVSWSARDVKPDTDFRLIFTSEKAEFGLNLLSYSKESGKGWFMLLAAPGIVKDKAQVIPKDLCFAIDTSGSMAGGKLDQAKKALKFCLENLNDNDRFEIVRFSTEAEALFGGMVKPDKANLAKAREFIDELKPIGGTAIHDAMQKALAGKPETGRPYMVVFLTDGLPTIGECREDEIVTLASKASAGRRVFTFGIGGDVNTHLLDRIGSETRAVSQYVMSNEDMEVKLSSFYTKIKEPMLTDVKVGFAGKDARMLELYPLAMPDIFKNDTLTIFGRYEGAGKVTVSLTGLVNGAAREFKTEADLGAANAGNSFIPVMWATRRVGWLLDQIRMNGENKELKDEVVRLAREYGIVTPYTSYLIIEDEKGRAVPMPMQTHAPMIMAAPGAAGMARESYGSLGAEAAKSDARSGDRAVHNAISVSKMRQASNMADYDAISGSAWSGGGMGGGPSAAAGEKVAEEIRAQAQNTVRVINARAFYQNGSVWVDSQVQAQANLKQVDIEFGSAGYFALAKKHPEAAAWFALGNRLQIVLGNQFYNIAPKGE